MDEYREATGKPAKVLVVWESKHGSTADISYSIAGVLRQQGLRVILADAAKSIPEDPFDAYVIGSAVYAGHWMKHVKQFVHDTSVALKAGRVWLFSSGPVGDPLMPAEPPVDVTAMVAESGARQHMIFGGNLDRAKLSFPERAIMSALRAPQGDFRDWTAIRTWAEEIAHSLTHKEARA